MLPLEILLATTLDWNHEWSASLLWSGGVFAVTTVLFVLVIWLLAHFTSWGRQFWQIAIPYFRLDRTWLSWRPLLTLLGMLWMTVLAVRLDVLLSYWTNGLYTALQQMNGRAFGHLLVVFGVLTMAYFVCIMAGSLIGQTFMIHWQVWLNDHMVGDWLEGRAYHRGQFVSPLIDNPDQRIQQDVVSFVTSSQTLSMGAVRSVVSLVSFTPILWALSGPLSPFGYTIPRAMVFVVYLYVIVVSVFAFRIGRPLIRLNFLNEGLGASFRYALVHLRDHSEKIAFHRGEDVERATLNARFNAIIKNRWRIVFRSLKFDGFNLAASQVTAVFPYLIQAPRFFSRAITLGDVQQSGVAFAQVHGALSFFRNAYDAFAAYRATLARLSGLRNANSRTRALPSVAVTRSPAGLDIENLTVHSPDGELLIENLTVHLSPGQALLVTGPSGGGKTTLLRALADLWPYAQGTVRRPQALFLSQQPYLPLGNLRTALAYPQFTHVVGDAQLRDVLQKVQLGHLKDRLAEEIDWSRILSPGEQQRLGFARILVNRPCLAFLDEATSAVDEGLEHALYTLVRRDLPECTLVSIGHRSTLLPLHTHHLELLGQGRWQRNLQRGSAGGVRIHSGAKTG